MDFHMHAVESAAAQSRRSLARVEAKYGFVPNIPGVLATSPAALDAYLSTATALEKSDLTALERQVVLITASHESGCDYCLATHTMAAGMAGASPTMIEYLRSGSPLLCARNFSSPMCREGHSISQKFNRKHGITNS